MAQDVQDLVSPLAGQLVGVVDDDGGLCGGKIVRYDRKQTETGPHLGFPNNPPLRITYRDTPPLATHGQPTWPYLLNTIIGLSFTI